MTRGRMKRIAGVALRSLVAAVTLFLVFQSVSWSSVQRAYLGADVVMLALGASLVIGNLWIRTAKWRFMLRALDTSASTRDAFWSLLLGISFGAVTPGEIGEFAGRALHVQGPARAHLIGLAVLDRLHIFLIWIAFGLTALLVMFGRTPLVQAGLSVLAVGISLFAFLHLDWLRSLFTRFNGRFLRSQWVERMLDGFGCLDARQRLVTLAYTAAFHLLLCVQMYFFLNAFHDVDIVEAVGGTSALMFVKAMLPISLGDLGIRELTSVYLFGWFGVPQVDAVNASLLLFVVNVILPGIVGLLALRRMRSRISDRSEHA